MPRQRARVQRSRNPYFDNLDDDDDEPFPFSPSILKSGGAPGASAAPLLSLHPHLPATAAQAGAAPGAALGIQTSFSDLANELLSVSASAPSGGSGGGGGGGGWDFSAFSAAPSASATAAGEGAAFSKKCLVLDALHRAHDSEAGAMSEKVRRQEMSGKRRGKLIGAIISATNYTHRTAAKSQLKLAKRKRLAKARGER